MQTVTERELEIKVRLEHFNISITLINMVVMVYVYITHFPHIVFVLFVLCLF